MQLEHEQRTATKHADEKPQIAATEGIRLAGLEVLNERDEQTEEIKTGRSFAVRLRIVTDRALDRPYWAIGLVTSDMVLAGAVSNEFDATRQDINGQVVVTCRFKQCTVLPGTYSIRVKARDTTTALLFQGEQLAYFRVVGGDNMRFGLDRAGLVYFDATWELA
jgi:hypothetical protein